MSNISEKSNYEIKEIHISSVDEFYSEIINKKFDMFRGESNSEWNLNSSMVRKIKDNIKNKSLVLNFNYLEKIVSNYKHEYNSKISNRHDFVRFLFYLQHAVSFSPFIDITEDPWIALSFSLDNVQRPRNYLKQNNAAIYAFEIIKGKGNNSNVLSKQQQVKEVLRRLSIGINKKNQDKRIVESYIIDIKDLMITNDRMTYQKGAFLLLNNYSIDFELRSNQVYSSEKIVIRKFIIQKKILGELYLELREKKPMYIYDFLLDPYIVFQDIDIDFLQLDKRF